jgi:hypothetical protein
MRNYGIASLVRTIAAVAGFALFTTACTPPVPSDSAVDPALEEALVAAAGTGGYLGMSLPASFRAFPGTLWTTPIASAAVVDPASSSQIATLRYALVEVLGRDPVLVANAVKYTAPIHVVDRATSPIVEVPCDSALPNCLDPDQDHIAESIPIPDAVWADPSDDGHMIIVDQANQLAYEFWNLRVEGPRLYRAGMMGKWKLNGQGWNAPGSDTYRERNGATASRAPYIGGLVRYEEVMAGTVAHALHMIVPTTRINTYKTPAIRTDGRNAGTQYIVEGARMQLDPALNLDTLGLSPASKVIARALQVYGACIMDTGSGWAIKLQNLGPDGGAWRNTTVDLSRIPIERFRVLK